MTTTIKPGGYAAENDRVQNDVKTFAAQLLADKGNPTAVAADLDAYHAAYSRDGGLNTDTQAMDKELTQVSGLSQSDKDTLASLAGDTTDIG